MQGKCQGRCGIWIISWALQIHSNTRIPLGSNKFVSKGWMETDDRRLHNIYVIWYSFFILGQSFARPFEVKQLPFTPSCSLKDENHLVLILNEEKWLCLKKSLWKVYHHSKCFGRDYRSFNFSTSINMWEAWL